MTAPAAPELARGRFPTCPATSPQSGTPCDLEDTAKAHPIGHLGTDQRLGHPHRVGWYAGPADRRRWGEPAADADD